uniref:Ribosomal protein L19 n=1 Tax=Bangiopsis subsimplex TaxID=139980 RepID=A0A1C9CCV2_9RHOD|nr:ribosomal protein L19 [Bangiopsis subsimplex]AOM66221.1 ribosomal protein L19 [Bangiopsis subsimplex]ARO90418.1 50S ribosomal protein L19 [Bangiopsis subsimplex]
MNFSSKINPKVINSLEKSYLKKNIPLVEVGDYVKVGILIQEGNKERIQSCQGVIISKKNQGINFSVVVRYSLQGIGVERTFLLHSPRISNITILKKSRIRRAKLYYLRSRSGKSTRLKTRFI